MSETNSALKSESEPASSEPPVSGESPALVSEPVDQASHNDGEVDPPADETDAAPSADEAAAAAPSDPEPADETVASAETPNDPADANTGAAEPNEGEDAPVAEGSRDWGAERLSAVEADALAESFRPSWETDWGADDSPPPAADSNLDAAAAAIAATPPSKGFDDPTPVLVSKPASVSPPDDTDAVAAIVPGEATARRNLLIGAGVFVLAIVVIMAFMLSSGEDTPDPAVSNAPGESSGESEETQASDEQTAAQEAPEPEPEVAPEPEPEPEPVTYQLTVRTVPADATLTLDGETVANPLTRTVEPDEAEHHLVATADGYREASTTVSFDGDHDTVLTLEAEPPPPPVAMVEPPPAQMRSTRRTRRTSMRTTAMRQARMRSRGAGFTTSNPY